MKQIVMTGITLVVAVSALILATLKKDVRIGYAETSVLLANFDQAIDARGKFEDSQKEWDKNINIINDSLMAAMARMKSNYEKSTPEQRRDMEQGLNRWNSDLQRYTNTVKRMSEEKEKALMEPVINKMNSFMKQWGEQNGYDMIFGTTNGGNILQANSAFNVTEKLLAELNEHYRDVTSQAGTPAKPEPSATVDSGRAAE